MANDTKLEYFKKLVMQQLDELEEKENAEKAYVKKSILEAESMQKAGYPVGTIREWKGKKYIKVAPGKWRPKYDSNSRGAKMSIAALKRKADKCTSSEELLQLILENRARFSDDNGRPLPFVKELSDYISQKNDAIESANKPAKTNKKAKMSVADMKAKDDEKLQINETPEDRAQVIKTRAFNNEIEALQNSTYKADSVEDAIKALEKHKDFVHSIIPQDETIHEKATREGREEAIQSIIDKLKQGIKDIIAMFVKAKEKKEEPDYKQLQEELKEEIKTGKRDNTEEFQEDVDEWENLIASGVYSGAHLEHLKDIVKIGKEELKRREDEKYGKAKEKTVKDIREKYEASKSVTGNKKTVTLPDGTKIKCHYKIVEEDAPTASHDERTFAPSAGFPTTKDGKSVNDRDYQNDADAQESVRKIASNFNSLALESPPIVTKDGIVISGNNRTMSSKLAAKMGTDKAYLQDLREMADEYGIEPEDLNGFENPRLILETDNEHEGDYTTEEFAQFNRDTKKTMNNVEKAVKITKTLNADKIQSIAESLQGYDTMGELYADVKGCQDFVNKLITAGIIGENEKAQYCRTDGTLNDTGKDFCETVLVGSVLNEDNIRKLDGAGGKRIRQKLVRAILPLIENKGTGKEYSFNTELNDAVNIAVTVSKDHDTFPDVKTYLSQGNLFGEKQPDAATSRLAEIIHDEGEKAFAQRMKDLGAGLRDSAAGEQDIFLGGVISKESLLDRFLEIKKSIAGILSKLGKREQSASELVASVLNNIA